MIGTNRQVVGGAPEWLKRAVVVGGFHGQRPFGHALLAGEGQGEEVFVDIGLRWVTSAGFH
jgi:hypothetical protein